MHVWKPLSSDPESSDICYCGAEMTINGKVYPSKLTIYELAAAESIHFVPSVGGMFDTRERLQVFAERCLARNLVPFLGYVKDKTDEEVDRLINYYKLL